jgi:hypothetical protein
MFRVGMPHAYQCFSSGLVDSVAFLSCSRWEESIKWEKAPAHGIVNERTVCRGSCYGHAV